MSSSNIGGKSTETNEPLSYEAPTSCFWVEVHDQPWGRVEFKLKVSFLVAELAKNLEGMPDADLKRIARLGEQAVKAGQG